MVVPRDADGEPAGQRGRVDQNPEPEGSVGVIGGRVHEDTALRIDVENFEGSRVEDSRVCVDRRGEAAWAESRRGEEVVAPQSK